VAIERATSSNMELMDHDSVDLGGMILFGMGQAVQQLRMLTGLDSPVVEFKNGATLIIEEQDPAGLWRDRLRGLQVAISLVCESDGSLDADDVCKAVLEADGWSWTRSVFRTPMWMLEHEEIPLDMAAREFKVLKWLVKYS